MDADCEFITHAREDIPLLERIKSQAAEITELRGQLTESQRRERAAVEFIQHLDREYSQYIADRGFEQWHGPLEAGRKTNEHRKRALV